MERREFLKLSMLSGLVSCATTLGVGAGAVEGYPSKDMTMVVPYPPGGIADSRGRLMAEWLEKAYGRTCLVENVPGASGMVGTNRVKNSPSDGHTFLSTTTGAMVVVPQLSQLEYLPLDVLVPVANCFVNPVVVMVPAQGSPYQTVHDIIEDARKRPGEVTYGTPGVNSLYHLTGEAMNTIAGVRMVHVPYKSAGQYTLDVLAGRISFAIGTVGTLTGAQGQLKGVMIGSAKRSLFAKDVPSAPEAGMPELVMPDGAGILMHIDTPREIVLEISDQMGKMVADEGTRTLANKLGVELDYLGADDYAERLTEQYELVRKVIAQAGLKEG